LKKNKRTAEITHKSGVEYFLKILSFCSLNCLFKLSRLMGFVLRYLPARITRITRLNIRLCFSGLSEHDQKTLINESFTHTCSNLLELAYLWNHPVEQVLKSITKIKITEDFYRSDKPRIIIAPHQGSWELFNLWLADQTEVYSLYKPAHKNSIDQYLLQKRTRNGARLLPTNTAGLRQLLLALKDKKMCMILPDQKPGNKMAQTLAPFFGHQVKTQLLVKKLISKVDCNVFIGAITRDLGQAQYSLRILPLQADLLLQEDGQSSAYLNQAIEDFVKPDIMQYQWSYRRFPYQAYNLIQ